MPKAASRRCVLAAWLLAPPAWCAVVVGGVGTLLAGPFALLLLPVVLPPLALLFVQARQATRLLRGRTEHVVALFLTACLGTAGLSLAAVIALPGPTNQPPPLREVPRDVLLGVIVLAALGVAQAVAAGLLLTTARHQARRISGRALVGAALAVLALAQAVALALSTTNS